MKYFTRKLAEGKVTEKAKENAKQKYLDNLYAIREELPPALRELAFQNLQGARIQKLKIDKINKLLQLKLSADIDLNITYDTIQWEDTQDEALETRAQDPGDSNSF